MNPYFMKRACEAENPLYRFKFVITNTISAFYYLSMFLKPVRIQTFSSTPSSVRHCKAPTPTALKSIASSFLTTLQSVSFCVWVLKTRIVIMVAITFLPMLGLILCNWWIKGTRCTNSRTGIKLTLLSINRFIQESFWAVWDQKQLTRLPFKIKSMTWKQISPLERWKRSKLFLR